MRREGLPERLNVRPVGAIGHADHLGPVAQQHGQEIEVARVVHQNGIAGFDEEAANEIDGGGGRVGQHEPVGRDADPALAELAGQMLTPGFRTSGPELKACRVTQSGSMARSSSGLRLCNESGRVVPAT